MLGGIVLVGVTIYLFVRYLNGTLWQLDHTKQNRHAYEVSKYFRILHYPQLKAKGDGYGYQEGRLAMAFWKSGDERPSIDLHDYQRADIDNRLVLNDLQMFIKAFMHFMTRLNGVKQQGKDLVLSGRFINLDSDVEFEMQMVLWKTSLEDVIQVLKGEHRVVAERLLALLAETMAEKKLKSLGEGLFGTVEEGTSPLYKVLFEKDYEALSGLVTDHHPEQGIEGTDLMNALEKHGSELTIEPLREWVGQAEELSYKRAVNGTIRAVQNRLGLVEAGMLTLATEEDRHMAGALSETDKKTGALSLDDEKK